MRNAIFLSPQMYFIYLAEIINKKLNINPKYFHSNHESYDFIERKFPDAINHNYYDSIKGIPPKGHDSFNKFDIDIDLINELSESEYISLSMMDRNDSYTDSFKYRERLEFYYKQVSYWAMIIRKFKIKYVFFEEEPHQATDYILYKVCEKLKIETVMFVRTISNFGILPMKKFEEGCVKLKKIYQENLIKYKNKEVESNPILEKYFKHFKSNYQNILKEHLWDQLESYEKLINRKNSKLSNYRFFIDNALRFFDSLFFKRIKLFNAKYFLSDQKEKNKPLSESNMNYSSYLFYKIKTTLKKISNRNFYNKISNYNLDLNQKFVLCALQYQPEKSTCPLGARCGDQFLMIKKLRNSLPDNIKIFVKEHPSQFIFDYTRYGEIHRDKEFYMKIINLDNIEIVPINFDIFSLIDKSLAVASVTGTICWEGVNRGKPAMCFGDSWMKNCEGIFTIKNQIDLQNIIKKIIDNEIDVSLKKVYIFALSIVNLNFRCAIGGINQLKFHRVSAEENAEIHFRAVSWLIEKKYK
mgnify:CR=1 FL=1|tara:strand:+ start:23364 stop:24941 length:1578 start_codon:yes stop_codon:yes gene_type:complete